MKLNSEQEAAVAHYKGPALVLAGPGSGKTTVITNRVRNLTKVQGLPAEQILVLTFTKAAAQEMQSRYLRLVEETASKVTFGTFHAVFFMILRDVYGYRGQDIIRVQEQRDFVRIRMKAKGMRPRDEQGVISDILSEIAKVKARQINLEAYESVSCEREQFAEFFAAYQDMLEKERRVDFEDMMLKTYQLLTRRQDVLQRWQERYTFILVDEFQDSSLVQFEILRLLAGTSQNLFAVGDDDQSIYGFRGADFRVMQQFCAQYKTAQIYRLNWNYRSAALIVQAAAQIINRNSARFPKNIQAKNQLAGQIEILRFQSLEEQAQYAAKRIWSCVQSKEELAVLTRTNFGAEEILRVLKEQGGGLGTDDAPSADIWEHWIVQDIAAYMRIACGCAKREDYLRIINKPMRDISRDFFLKAEVEPAEVILAMKRIGQTELADTFASFCSDMAVMGKLPPFAGLTYLRKSIGYERYLIDCAEAQRIGKKEWTGILNAVGESMKDCQSYAQWMEKAESMRIQRQPGTRAENAIETKLKAHRISFCTMHRAKGLEFDAVLIPDANDKVMPYEKAFTKEALEEERRLFYVAMTRARTKIILCFVEERYNKKVQPSPYVKELHKQMKIPYSESSSA